jgi:hypothetical protein
MLKVNVDRIGMDIVSWAKHCLGIEITPGLLDVIFFRRIVGCELPPK